MLPAPSDGCSPGGCGKAWGSLVVAALSEYNSHLSGGLETAVGEDHDGLASRRRGCYAAMLLAPSDGCSSGGRGRAWGAVAAAAEGSGVVAVEDGVGSVAHDPGGVCQAPPRGRVRRGWGWWVGVWRVGSGGWWGVVPPFALQRASKPPGRLLNLLCEAPCPHHSFVIRFCFVGLGGLVGGRPGFRGGSAAPASPRPHFDP